VQTLDAPWTWSAQQEGAMKIIRDWLRKRDRPWLYCAGWAGTGKTTMVREITKDIPGTFFAAYTGKAASVLQRYNGVPAQTLHSLIYNVSDADQTRLLEMKVELACTEPGSLAYRELEAEIRLESDRLKGPRFSLNPDAPLKGAPLLVLDECSMVNQKLAEDVLSFNVPILVLGDPAQLRPVKGGGYFTNRKPDVMLTDIRRQALDNPIIRWSKIIREGGYLSYGVEGPARMIRKGSEEADAVGLFMAGEDVQLLTGKNETRRKLNLKTRRRLGRTSWWPQKGDRLVCLRNDRDWGVLNGVLCESVTDSTDTLDDECVTLGIDYEGRFIGSIPGHLEPFKVYQQLDRGAPIEEPILNERHLLPFDYGYCLTVHKSQGSQWRHVVLCDDGFAKRDPAQRREWMYTAITRATSELTIIA
jgi:exodeoxyribonuclease-5